MNRFVKLFFALFAMTVAATACSSDDDPVVVVSTNKSVALSVDLANVDWTGVDQSSYDLRVVVELRKEGDKSLVARNVRYVSSDATNSLKLNYSVANQDYWSVVWCDFVESGKQKDLVYSASDLECVGLTSDSYLTTGDLRKSYYDLDRVNLLSNGETTLAQKPVVCATKVAAVVTPAYTSPYSVDDLKSIKVTYISKIPTIFNAVNNAVAGESSDKSFTYDVTSSATSFTLTDYIVTALGESVGNYTAKVQFFDNGGGEIAESQSVIF